MAYFPLFIDLKNKTILIIGGGQIAFHKFQILKQFEPKFTVVSKSFIPEFYGENGIQIVEGAFSDSMLNDVDVVVTATDDNELNSYVAGLCKEKRIPVNSVDDIDNCSFIFPSLIVDGKLTVGISTSGSSPTMASYLKNLLSDTIPSNISELLDYLNAVRSIVKDRLRPEKARLFYKELVSLLISESTISEECFNELLIKYEE